MKGGEAERSEAYSPPCVQEGKFNKVYELAKNDVKTRCKGYIKGEGFRGD